MRFSLFFWVGSVVIWAACSSVPSLCNEGFLLREQCYSRDSYEALSTGHLFFDMADFNQDSFQDLVVGTLVPPQLTIFINDQTGHFSAQETINASPSNNLFALAGDLNQDHLPELISLDSAQNRVGVFFQDEALNFGTQQMKNLGIQPSLARLGDVDSDGVDDLVVVNSSPQIEVLRNLGNGTFEFPSKITQLQGGLFALSPLSDLNGDQFLDLVFSTSDLFGDIDEQQLCLLLNDTSGNFPQRQCFSVGGFVRAIAVADLNSDQILDLATETGSSSQTFTSLLHNQGGTPPSFVKSQLPSSAMAPDILAQDLNQDGLPELITPDSNNNRLSVRFNQGDFQFETPVFLPTNEFPTQIRSADFNQDGIPDLVAFLQFPALFSVFLSQPTP